MPMLKKLHHFKATNLAIVLFRLWLGTVMIKHSGSYLFGGKVPELAGFLESLNWPAPELMAWSSQISEFVAAILILLGVRLGAIIMAFTMFIAVTFAHGLDIYGEAELPFNYFIFALVLSLTGCGKPALDNALLKQ